MLRAHASSERLGGAASDGAAEPGGRRARERDRPGVRSPGATGQLPRLLASISLGLVRSGSRLLACATLALGMAASLPAGLGAADASAATTTTRDSLANGCFGLRAAVRDRFVVRDGSRYRASAPLGGAEPFRVKATGPGSYLLQGRDRALLAVDVLGRVVPDSTASQAAEWVVRPERGGRFTLLSRREEKFLAVSSSGRLVLEQRPDAFTFSPSTGCSQYPEIEVGASGAPPKGRVPYGEVSGLIDGHMHQMAFEFLGGRAHCGRPWHPLGASHALQDCPDHEPNGAGAVLENTVSYGNPAGTHDTDGWPTFKGWPHHVPRSPTSRPTTSGSSARGAGACASS
jgi:hypothetical protein